ncbi:hypothetical protein AJ80_08347 [Polytolypa hystricis UAMH7299]|uniref:BHLH domain-containing protein n=1 Tax=Polytolypa hystricis (strain UAMH7299) TaxID=1447883 RepID=A0A2B7X907_POLH7|nr:hypothetical protein AJ80_08347 [Polytolypa hystricis UAMH7299]
MSKPRLPLTPASSLDIAAQDKDKVGPAASPGEMYFALPPAAIPDAPGALGAGSTRHRSHPQHPPLSPISPDVHAATQDASNAASSTRPTTRQRSGTKRSAAEFNLPPPPTRTRKIIQMKPKIQQQEEADRNNTDATAAAGATTTTTTTSSSTSKKKQNAGATTAAGRKIARKTAHSLIERRRRSKMNEEFNTLKNMIPACKGQEMHKLAILQASIDYVNYLERCISDLKANSTSNGGDSTPTSPTSFQATRHPSYSSMQEDNPPHNHNHNHPASLSTSPSIHPSSLEVSPAFSAQEDTDLPRRPYENLPNILPSPALGPNVSPPSPPYVIPLDPQLRGTGFTTFSQHSNSSSGGQSWTGFSSQQTRHVEGEDMDVDREASAALLMLNVDRRVGDFGGGASNSSTSRGANAGGGGVGRRKMGMSVQDLLSS